MAESWIFSDGTRPSVARGGAGAGTVGEPPDR